MITKSRKRKETEALKEIKELAEVAGPLFYQEVYIRKLRKIEKICDEVLDD